MVSTVLGLIMMLLSFVMGLVFSDSWIGLMGWIGFAMFIIGIDLGHIKRDVNALKPKPTPLPMPAKGNAELDSKESEA